MKGAVFDNGVRDAASTVAPKAWEVLRMRIAKSVRRPRIVRSLISLFILIVIWELTGRFILTNKLFFVPLSDIVVTTARLAASGELERDMAASFKEIAYGMILAVVIGNAFGVLLGASRVVSDYTEVYVNALYSTPLVAVAPLLILWFGIGIASKVAVVFIISVFPIAISTASGVRNVDFHYLDVAHAFGATRRQVVVKVLVPAALPFVLTGVRLAIGRAIVGVVVGEMFGGSQGIGFMVAYGGQTFATDTLFVGVLIIALAGIVLSAAAEQLEKRFSRWRPER